MVWWSSTAAVGAAAVFVPFPAAVDDHQTMNARFLVDQGAGLLLPQQDMNPEKLAELLRHANRPTLLRWAEAAHKLARTDATERVVAACEELAR
jgi:UDP-N-acetylglucosamine--N-acetylmuramyl-(pentapeptide) pyrophosphoryl-undecaprenol N-acetylglucosamine transferase